ncbi:hypothetical protein C8F04DRAFT_1195079 [Mycena alexandri]|uniref:Uncharacterized protein n=1 Tax=Mycena alexandri TaxID=1745969 RepID=A0AAD6S8P1_9AGAR|nr:hypothetical protein C8F04DRAFT_1195079 [Mycena alexandri]
MIQRENVVHKDNVGVTSGALTTLNQVQRPEVLLRTHLWQLAIQHCKYGYTVRRHLGNIGVDPVTLRILTPPLDRRQVQVDVRKNGKTQAPTSNVVPSSMICLPSTILPFETSAVEHTSTVKHNLPSFEFHLPAYCREHPAESRRRRVEGTLRAVGYTDNDASPLSSDLAEEGGLLTDSGGRQVSKFKRDGGGNHLLAILRLHDAPCAAPPPPIPQYSRPSDWETEATLRKVEVLLRDPDSSSISSSQSATFWNGNSSSAKANNTAEANRNIDVAMGTEADHKFRREGIAKLKVDSEGEGRLDADDSGRMTHLKKTRRGKRAGRVAESSAVEVEVDADAMEQLRAFASEVTMVAAEVATTKEVEGEHIDADDSPRAINLKKTRRGKRAGEQEALRRVALMVGLSALEAEAGHTS